MQRNRIGFGHETRYIASSVCLHNTIVRHLHSSPPSIHGIGRGSITYTHSHTEAIDRINTKGHVLHRQNKLNSDNYD